MKKKIAMGVLLLTVLSILLIKPLYVGFVTIIAMALYLMLEVSYVMLPLLVPLSIVGLGVSAFNLKKYNRILEMIFLLFAFGVMSIYMEKYYSLAIDNDPLQYFMIDTHLLVFILIQLMIIFIALRKEVRFYFIPIVPVFWFLGCKLLGL